ncbi:hypothetical protein ACIO3O_23910 [Streptomyces sp. NPDC087440]|uniref:hypothetical protein n=1 Tax=Streptomyces sp. NPDC087440 TaxID=3365790 RepID=UPI003805B2E0
MARTREPVLPWGPGMQDHKQANLPQSRRPAAEAAVRVQPRHVPPAAQADAFFVEPLQETRGQASCDFLVPNAPVPDVQMNFGQLYAEMRKRPITDGFGFAVELPAVLDLLAHVDSGALTADSLRRLLLQAAAALYEPLGCVHAEDPDAVMNACRVENGCQLCAHHRGHFDKFLDTCDDVWKRLAQPTQYPFIVSQRSVHRAGCSIVYRETPDSYARPRGDAYPSALREYSHSIDRHGDLWAFHGARRYPRLEALNAYEIHFWIAQRTGPRGGMYFKLCQRCSPAV